MCGISGILSLKKETIDLQKKLILMNLKLKHRGPDGNGIWKNTKSYIGLGHTRLSIIDLNNRAAQPMSIDNLVISFNGEIYNYDTLREDLKSIWNFTTLSDTEVILAAYKKYGNKCVNFLEGMFSFAIWDSINKTLFCARDRIGIKPFYYMVINNIFYFASEVKALLPCMDKIEEDIDGIGEYLIFQYPITNKTMFKNIRQLMPGNCILINNGNVNISKYWDLDYSQKHTMTKNECKTQLRKLFEKSIEKHLKSDVPVSSYISGGIDSGLVTILANNKKKLHSTYHGRFIDYEGFDESQYAKIIETQNQLKLKITDITSEDFKRYIKEIIYHLDYPVVGPGSFPQYMVSKVVSENVKVVLGGQGGDEIFSGYTRYLLPYLEVLLEKSIDGNTDELKEFLSKIGILKEYKPMLKMFFSEGMFEDLCNRYFKLIDRSDVLSEVINWNLIDRDSIKKFYNEQFNNKLIPETDFFNKMLDFDLKYSLPALLQVEDRMSMAWGVESRVPIIDHSIVEFVAKIPEDLKVDKGNMKALLKDIFKNELPQEIINRRDKMGFPVPLNDWFNCELREFIIGLVKKLKERNLSYLQLTETFINDLEKSSKFSRKIWILISLELWYENYFDL